MSDLTRRVLDAAKHNGIGAYPTRYTEPVITCANAAPILARQVEAVERRCAAMEPEGQPLAYAAALIRDALNTTD